MSNYNKLCYSQEDSIGKCWKINFGPEIRFKSLILILMLKSTADFWEMQHIVNCNTFSRWLGWDDSPPTHIMCQYVVGI